MLSEEEFCAALATYFGLEREILATDALSDDLALDSVEMYEIIFLIEDLLGHEIHDSAVESFTTVASVYGVYQQTRQS